MNRLCVAVACVLTVLLTSTLGMSEPRASDEESQIGELHIKVIDLNSNEGIVNIGLYDKASHFAVHTGSFQKAELPIVDHASEWVLEDIPYGDYAIMFYHDENGNHQLDRNFFRFPSEPYGFSNNAWALLRIPSFRAARFSFKEPVRTIEVTVQ